MAALPQEDPLETEDALGQDSSVEPDDADDLPQPMSDETFEAVVKAAIDDASNYIDGDIASQRQEAQKYYFGEPFGDEEEGRSKVVMTEVRDTILAMMPSLLRVFTSSEKPVEFAPRRQDAIPMAEQATDYVSYVFYNDNPGFALLYGAIKDALKSKLGVFKWYTATDTQVREESYTGLDQGQMQMLSQEPGVEIVAFSETVDGMNVDPMTGQPVSVFTANIRRKTETRRQVVEILPPEEFLIARNARDLDTADFVGHRSLKTLSELVAMGYDREDVEEHATISSSFEINTEAQTRNPALQNFLGGTSKDSSDKAMQRYLYVECYIRVDKDGDGIAELRRVCAVGDTAYVLHEEVVDDVKFACICPDPEPHMVIGSSMADQVKDLQLIKSRVVRNTLDSLAQVIHPRTVVVEGQVNMDDVLNVETGGIIRQTQPGMVQELTQTFVGQQAMPIIAWLDDVKASRTGISKASQGLDPDVLQSTTRAAVTATMSAAQERLEMVARIFAETGIKRLFKGLLKEIIRNQDQPRVVRLRNQWVPVDPRTWDADMDVIVNVGLGTGSPQEKAQALMLVSSKQQEILQTLGPENPLCDLKQYRDTMVRILDLNGIRDGSRYFKEVTPEAMQQMAQGQGQEKQDPATLLAQVQAQQIQADIKIAQDKAILEAAKQKASDDLERDKLDADIWLRATEMQLKYGAQLNVERLYAMIQRERNVAQVAAQQQQMAMRQQAQQMAPQEGIQ